MGLLSASRRVTCGDDATVAGVEGMEMLNVAEG
jgi:hypothetical protein